MIGGLVETGSRAGVLDDDGSDPSKSKSSPTLSVKAYEEIRHGLINGQFMPGDHLTLRELSASMGISTTPVREALQRLAAEGALVLNPNRSVVVPDFSDEEISTIWRMRIDLEGQSAYLAALKATAAQQDDIKRGLDEMSNALRTRDAMLVMGWVAEWSFAIARGSQSHTLLHVIRNLRTLTGPRYARVFRNMDDRTFADIDSTIQLSRNTTTLIMMREAEAARDSQRADLQVMAKLVLA